ncbi:MAG: four helix bundle protein [Verrucomicrobia bacterium]|jgi:four helix bundle protein|nr:four helix bundle protein [Verrucomicrobiota bacterium]
MKDHSINPDGGNSVDTVFHLAHERLEVYRMGLAFVAWVAELLEEVEASGVKRLREVMDRASLSLLLNTAEGNGKRLRPVRAKFFDHARGSATECAACPDALVARKAACELRVAPGKPVLVQTIAMLSRLIEISDEPCRFKEDEVPYLSEGFDASEEACCVKDTEIEKD